MIRVLLDQNIPAPIVEWLQQAVGDDAEIASTRTLRLHRMSDEELFAYCQSHKMIIVTYDEDFQNPLVSSRTPGFGVVRLNVYPTGLEQTKAALQRLLAHYLVTTWENASIVVNTNKIRYQKK